jgi:hypothetical protein
MDIYNLICLQEEQCDRYGDCTQNSEFNYTGAVTRQELIRVLSTYLFRDEVLGTSFEYIISYNGVTIYNTVDEGGPNYDRHNANPYAYPTDEYWEFFTESDNLEEEHMRDSQNILIEAKALMATQITEHQKKELAKKETIANEIKQKEFERKWAEYLKLKKELGET